MKIKWIFIKFVLLIGVVIFLFSFSKKRNEARNIKDVEVEFINDSSPFITVNTVNKLLIQSNGNVKNIGKETLVLKELEQRLIENPMVRDAQVFITIDGTLGAKIEQRQPLGRISGSPDVYLDADGKVMPLSDIYSERVPLISGKSKTNFAEVTPVLHKINEDEFMKTSVIGIEEYADGSMSLKLRNQNFDVFIGKPKALEKKFQNFKAFYAKTKNDSILDIYKRINLQFESQVVAVKK